MRQTSISSLFSSFLHSSSALTRLAVVSSAALVAGTQGASALPSGANVESGAITISNPGAGQIVIDQATDRGIINWDNFDILQGESARFNQLSSSSVTLNRIRSGSPTQILGNLSANGKLIVVNASGVFFGAGSRVDVAGLIATTADIRSADFNAGRLNFDQAGRPDASIINKGTITAAQGGLVALVAPSVRNDGIIQANLGTVALGASKTFTVDLYGDNLYSFSMGEKTTQAGRDENGNIMRDAVANHGTVSANGGKVLLTANAARDVVDNAINTTGIVEAASVRTQGGAIILDGGEGSVRVAGNLNASGKQAGEKGGRVQITGKKITLAGATVDAAGHSGGGNVRIGGDVQGGGSIAHADYVDVDSASLIDVSAIDNGNGGSSVVWSDIATNFYGRLRGRGGENGGNGGFAEVSSKQDLDYNGAADLGATNGLGGELLIDPTNFTVNAGNVAGFLATLNGGTNVTITTPILGLQAGNLTVDAAMSWTGIGSLVLNAINNIIVNANITSTAASGGNITMNAGNSVRINSAVSTNDGNINLTGLFGNIRLDAGLNSTSGNITLTSLGNINLGNGINIDAGTGALTVTSAFGSIFTSAYSLSGTGVTFNGDVVCGGNCFQFNAGSGALTFNDTFTNNTGFSTYLRGNDFVFNDTITSSTNIHIVPGAPGATLGLAGAAGSAQLSVAELNRFVVANNLVFDYDFVANAHTWAPTIGALIFGGTYSDISFQGDQQFNQSVRLNGYDSTMHIGANLINIGAATNTFTVVADGTGGTTLGLGGGTGSINLSDSELDFIANGWNFIRFQTYVGMDVGAYNNWRDPVQFLDSGSGSILFSGDQASAAGSNANFAVTGGDSIINANIDFSASNGSILLEGFGGTHALGGNLIGNGITINGATTLTGALGSIYTLNAGTGTLTINNDGVNNFGSVDVTGRSLNFIADNMTIGGGIFGSGNAYFRGATLGRTMGLAGGAGDLQIDSTELDLITASNQVYGDASGIGFTSGDVDVGARNWMGHGLTVVTTGKLTVSGNQDYSAMTYLSLGGSDYDITANLTDLDGTNSLLFYFTGTPMTIGGAAGSTNIDSVELERIQDGFASIQFGAGAASNVTVNAYGNWRDPIQFTNAGTLTVNGVQTATSGSDARVQFASGGLTTINSNVDFSDSTTGGIHFAGAPVHAVNLAANLFSGSGGITIDRAVNLVGAGVTRRIDAGTGGVTVNNDGVSTFGAINGTNKNLRLFGSALNLNGSTISSTSGNIRFDGGSVTLTGGQINSTSGNIRLNNTGVFFSSLANSLITGGTGTIELNQVFGGSINNAIAAISNSGTGQNTVNVGDGTFVENVVIDHNNLRLRSINGRDATTITGISGVGALGTIVVLNNVNNSQIGGVNRGFTINGIDNGNAAIENAAIYYQGNHNTTLVRDNRIVAMGDSALVTEYGLNNANFTIDGNIITGNTFTGADGAWGVGNQFVVPNVPRQLVAFNQGLSNVVFTNNQITGNSGTAHLVAIESAGTNVAGNTFTGLTHGAALRLRGSGVTVTSNTVDGSNRGNGMHISGVADSIFTNNNVANTNIGIWIDGSNNATITGGTLTNNTTGIRINPSVSGLIDGVTVIGGTTGFEVVSSDDTTIQNSFVTDALTGISVSDSTGFIATNNVLNSNAITPTTNAGFDLINTTGAQLTGNTIRGFRTGINFNGGSNGTVTGGIIRSADVAGINGLNHVNLNVSGTNIRTTGTSAEGINLSGGSATISGVTITTRGNGIYADGLTALSIKGSTVDAPSGQNGQYGIRVNNTPHAQIGGLALGEGNTVSNMDYGIVVSSSLGADILGNTINGDNNHTGILVNNSDNIAVQGNILQVLSDLGNVAFEFDAIRVFNSTYADIRQNILTAANDGQLAGRYGIYVDGSHGTRIRGNDLTANSGGTLARNDAIRATGSNYIDIRNNDLIANGGTISRNGSAIHVLGTPYATIFRNDLTASNGGILAGQDGIWAEWADGATINNNRITVTGEFGITPIGRDGIHVSFDSRSGGSVAEINNNTITAQVGNIVDRHGIHVENYGNAYFVSEMDAMMIGWPYFAPEYTGGLVIDDNIITGAGVDGTRVRGDGPIVLGDDSPVGGDEGGDESFIAFGDLPPEGSLALRAPLQITNNRITNTGDDGIDVAGAQDVIINDNRIRNAGGNGIIANLVSQALRNNVRFTDDHGITLRDSDGLEMTDNLVRDAEDDGIRITNSSNAVLTTNTVRRSGRGIHVLSSGDGVSDNVTLDRNTTRDNDQEGVRVRSGNGHTIIGNVSENNGAQGFRIIGSGNTLIDSNTATGNDAAGIRVEDSEVMTITNNFSNDNLRGIRVLNGSNITVTGNTTNDNTREGIRFDAVVNSPAVTGNTMIGNLVGFAAYNGTDNLTVRGNVFTNNAIGVLFNNSDNGRLETTTLDIATAGTGLRLENGAGNFIVRDVTFNGGEVAVLIDGGIIESEEELPPFANGPTGMQFESNGSFFNGNNFYFILQNGAMIGETLIATQQTFDGTRAANFTIAQRDAAEAKTIDVEDGFAVGDVFYRDFLIDGLDEFLSDRDNLFNGDIFSYAGFTLESEITNNPFSFEISSLNLSLLNTAAGGGGNSPGDLNNLSTAAGGETPEELASLETAAGGNNNCGNSFLGSGYQLGYSADSCSTQ